MTLFEWPNEKLCSAWHERISHQFSFEWSLTSDSSTFLLSVVNSSMKEY